VKNVGGQPVNYSLHRFELLVNNSADPVERVVHLKNVDTGVIVTITDIPWEDIIGHYMKDLMENQNQ